MGQTPTAKTGVQGRRSERVLLKIPIEVAGKSAEGKNFREKTNTLVINRHGARITLRNSPQPESKVTITNLFNQVACPFRVVGRTGRSLGEGPEWGMECLEPDANVWGIYFPAKAGGAAPDEEPIDALLECTKCASRELAQLVRNQYQTLATLASIPRDCSKCKGTTPWRFAFVESAPEEVTPEPPKPPAPALPSPAPHEIPQPAAAPPPPAVSAAPPAERKPEERRKVRRVTLKLPVRVRLPDGKEEVTRTENYSRNGACFIATFELKADERIFVTLNYKPGADEIETPARVVWRRAIEGSNQSYYGVEFQGRK